MMPLALALLTIALLKPDSCQAIAEASEAGAPLAAAIEPICDAVRRPGVPVAAPCGGTLAAATTGTLAAGAAAGILRRVPAITKALGCRPLAAASAAGVMPLAAAMPVSVSPGTTKCPPPAVLPDAVVAAGAVVVDAPPGSRSDVPARIVPFGSMPLAAASALIDVPSSPAILPSESPSRTR